MIVHSVAFEPSVESLAHSVAGSLSVLGRAVSTLVELQESG